ncbi:glutathione s-transferase [Colletotrichum kahawae]|uniref:Glutathione s-transferase n=1 Tax=Colletotrichum kahawae TaxID=34407 RepID=A0AAD9Y6F9_COLKA|nr:glutathione s-transferase [Colletotrichum kahawae]
MDTFQKQRPGLVLYRGFPVSTSYVWSPFVTKLEARLRFARLKYRLDQGSMSKAPRGKVPYLEFAPEGQEGPLALGDSSLIIQHLVDNDICEDLNKSLSPAAKAHDMAVRTLFEEKLYFYQGMERWHDNYETMRSGVMGTGRFTSAEVASFRHDIWENANALLAEARLTVPGPNAPFWILGGSEPSEADATVFGFIASGLVCNAAPDTQSVIRSYPVLVDYAKRIHEHYFSEYKLWDDEI